MPRKQNYRMRPETVKADHAALNALRDLEDYAPLNPAYSVAELTKLDEALTQALKNEERVQNALKAAHDAVAAAQWALHEGLLGAKIQVAAQYGDDSDAIQSLGLKKKSKRRRPVSRALKTPEQLTPA
jgi:hypothetical protein